MTLATAENFHTYYHVAVARHELGSNIGPIQEGQRSLFINSHPPGGCEAETEALLDRHKPPSEIPRHKCVFLFETPQQCIAYWNSQYGERECFIYKVKTERICSHPMVLVDRIYRLLRDQIDTPETVFHQIANEYWHPSRVWRFPEFLCDSCMVVERYARNELTFTNMEPTVSSLDYDCDRRRANEWVNELISGDPPISS